MSCNRAFEIDLEDLLAEPGSDGLREFEAHCAGCPACAGELALQRGLLARLKGEAPAQAAHPADARLLALAHRPESLAQAERSALRAHLRDCRPCDDAYHATLMLVPEPAPSLAARAAEWLRGVLAPAPLRRLAPVAAALVLAVGVTWGLDPLGLREPAGPIFRGVPGEFAIELSIAPGERGALSLYGLEDDDVALLYLDVSPELWGRDVRVTIADDAGAAVFEGPLSWQRDDRTRGFVEPRAGIFAPDSYRIELDAGPLPTRTYWLDVR